jgi:hypothetical protein
MSKEVKVKILDMTYDQDNNLFQMEIEELVGDHKKVVLAIAGADFGISKEIPLELAQEFCDAMKGTEKNLHIHKDNTGIDGGNVKKSPVEALHKTLENVIGYPIDEVAKSIQSKSKDNVNEN